ncbi:MAG: dTMP kinase [Syntrophales bacterium]|nr:dTMP kinase [Syntrophales bacterium]
MGQFITFEGIEGCGKTTQIRMASEYLKRHHIPFLITSEPGGTPLGEKIREILLNRGGYKICAEAEILLFSAARVQHVRDVISPALSEGKIVLCDRFSDSTMVYQGLGRGLDLDFIRGLNAIVSVGLKPDLTLVFDLPVEIGLKRARERMRFEGSALEDRFEREDLEFHRRIREGYLLLAKQEPGRFRVIDGEKDIISINREVCSYLRGRGLVHGRH